MIVANLGHFFFFLLITQFVYVAFSVVLSVFSRFCEYHSYQLEILILFSCAIEDINSNVSNKFDRCD